uniref:Uncharacterized protein n=1 Tax=Strombidium rassoulzadegani TaxID=1082188 RepID=A0A7S3FUA7_9SPIT|mmetsp:Transcript_12904/g.21823  ORF Transcript_12904/g.21823 Transcript_12904/m.21823 type:complete len:296 (+) Transcript_12904:931-1818(+)
MWWEKHAQLNESQLKPVDVQKEDLMKIYKADKKAGSEEDKLLPQMIRDYILHDRGNSIFLSDSFANLPSPVSEGKTIKNLFKFNEEEGDEKKKFDRENKEKNEIRIEGKEKGKESTKKQDQQLAKKLNLKLFNQNNIIQQIDKIVFDSALDSSHPPSKRHHHRKDASGKQGSTSREDQEQPGKEKEPRYKVALDSSEFLNNEDPYLDLQETRIINQMKQIDSSIDNSFCSRSLNNDLLPYPLPADNSLGAINTTYQEEDSYVNPSNISRVNQSAFIEGGVNCSGSFWSHSKFTNP